MKSVFFFLMVLLTATAVAVVGQTPPPGGWPNCNGCLFQAYWSGSGAPNESSCEYDDCSGDCGTMLGLTNLDLSGNTITMVVGNSYVAENSKSIYIRLQGGGSNGDEPTVEELVASPVGSSVIMGTPQISVDGANWVVEVWAKIFPQPDLVTLTVTVPGSPTITDGWVYECCTRTSIPSITQWGMVVLVGLLIISAVWIFMSRRRKSIAGA